MASSAFQIPLALDGHGVLVDPSGAKRNAAYRCPECKGVLDLHAGDKKRRHFHHRPSGTGCSSESVAHLVAKQLIARAVEARLANEGASPVFVRRCAMDECDAEARQPLPAKVRRVAIEYALYSGRVVDVALLGPGDVPIAAIEVLHTHEVDPEKTKDLPIPWIEVDAESVCETRGLVLAPTQDHFLPWLCATHASERKSLARSGRETLAEPKRRADALRRLPFALEDFPGFRAGELVTCENGHAAIVITWDGKQPPFPRPPLVVARERSLDFRYDGTRKRAVASLPFRRYWVTVCAVCGAPLSAP